MLDLSYDMLNQQNQEWLKVCQTLPCVEIGGWEQDEARWVHAIIDRHGLVIGEVNHSIVPNSILTLIMRKGKQQLKITEVGMAGSKSS